MLLLLKNHKVKRKDDNKVTFKDLDQSEYILIDTSTTPTNTSHNYVMIDPSKIPRFTKAKILYQLIYVYDDYDAYISSFVGIPPIEIEVYTISEVITLLNCIDRLYIPNKLIENDYYFSVYKCIIVDYFEVVLYDNDKEVYHKVFKNKEDIDDRFGKIMKFPLKAVKKFHDIYNTDIIRDLSINNEYIYIYKDMTWSRAIVDHSFMLIGIPLIFSRTITFLTDKDYMNVMNISGMDISYNIIYIYDKRQRSYLKHLIDKGEYDEVGLGNYDFICCSTNEYGNKNTTPYRFFYLEVLSHIGFSIRLTSMVYRVVEGYDEMEERGEGISSIVSLDITNRYSKKKNNIKSLMMNEDTLISLDEILSLL